MAFMVWSSGLVQDFDSNEVFGFIGSSGIRGVVIGRAEGVGDRGSIAKQGADIRPGLQISTEMQPVFATIERWDLDAEISARVDRRETEDA